MILKGSQRGGAGQLARHLMNDLDNDHIELEQLRGFISSDLEGALEEVDAISKGTRCKQFMFSLSLNPPKDAAVNVDDLLRAADEAEKRLGLDGQPRAVVIHEKMGRRHAHVVWSRIDAQTMKAVELPYFKNRLAGLSKELYLEHGWSLPDGHKENGWKNPLNFTLAEWQQAKRVGLDPREIKQLFRDAWQHSDGLKSFRAALEDRGYYLARGDRRGFVAVDVNGEVFSVARMIGVKTRDMEARLGSAQALPSVEMVKSDLNRELTDKIADRLDESRREQAEEMKPLLMAYRHTLVAQRAERKELATRYDQERLSRTKDRATRFGQIVKRVREFLGGSNRGRVSNTLDHSKGTGVPAMSSPQAPRAVPGWWERVRDALPFIRSQLANESFEDYQRHRREREKMIEAQMQERRDALQRILDLRAEQRAARMRMGGQIALLLNREDRPLSLDDHEHLRRRRARARGLSL